jgi:hypothetical protein
MNQLTQGSERARNHQYAESEGRMWDSEEDLLLDPKVIEPSMYFARPESESGGGFHARAERLNGRLAMLGFASGVILEFLTGHGIL